MRGSSLATRLFLSATAWVVVILLLTGVVLSSVYRNATERAFDRRLNLYLRTLIAEVATPDEPPERQFQSLGEPLFELPLSGWYWQIARTDLEKAETRASRSLWDKKLPRLEDSGAELTPACVRPDTVAIHHWAATWTGEAKRWPLSKKIMMRVARVSPSLAYRLRRHQLDRKPA